MNACFVFKIAAQKLKLVCKPMIFGPILRHSEDAVLLIIYYYSIAICTVVNCRLVLIHVNFKMHVCNCFKLLDVVMLFIM